MNPKEMKELVDQRLVIDCSKKMALDFVDVMRRNEDIFFGRTLPEGLADYLALVPLSNVMGGILAVAVKHGHIDPKEIDPLLSTLGNYLRDMALDSSKVEVPSECP